MELETSRLILKPVSKSDKPILQKIFTDDFVKKYLFDDESLSLEQTSEFVETSSKTFAENGYGLWLLKLKETNETVGFGGLWTFFDEAQPQILYGLLPKFTKRGLAAEAARKIIEYAFENLGFENLTASCDLPNEASHRVAENSGMKKFKQETIEGKTLIFFKIERG